MRLAYFPDLPIGRIGERQRRCKGWGGDANGPGGRDASPACVLIEYNATRHLSGYLLALKT